ncbi:tetratricopeptide repeat protein [Deinococcus sp. Arct2-2]|uniref:tetratricopeptide repeat protein n=1 Tax=Deinococcus sp. Arct2-2 TaxID=2568653 RepID=UPI0010A3BB0A|nr:tetratricopeptide repeat protein [Deinococcus sp. Arct2-2]THF69469.1 tetratricopeptide repeat protein [Deinococcus sp. Arct2-2]
MTDPAREGVLFAVPDNVAPDQPALDKPAPDKPVLDNLVPESERLPTPPDPKTVSGPSEPVLDWKPFARNGEWRRAQAAAHLLPAPPDVFAALVALVGVQDDVRARKYPAARRALGGYAESLKGGEAAGLVGEMALLRSLAAPEVLDHGLAALETGSGIADPGELSEVLKPAHTHPLTQAEAYNALGVLHALREEPDAARSAFGDARRLDPGHYRALMNLGNLDLEAGRPAEAEMCYREVLKLAPDYEGAHHNLGVSLRRQGKVYESVGSIRRAQRLSVRRSQQETREDMREQFRSNPKLRAVRWVLLAAAVLIVVLIFRSAGG